MQTIPELLQNILGWVDDVPFQQNFSHIKRKGGGLGSGEG